MAFVLRRAYLQNMKQFLATALTALIPAALFFGAAHADPLVDLQWKKRVLVLFDQSRSSASLDRQIDRLRERRPDVDDRDLIVIVNAGNQRSLVAMGYAPLPASAALQLKRRLDPAPRGMTMVLIGKDGTEKQRWNRTIDPQEIFDIIDAMPMRQREMDEES